MKRTLKEFINDEYDYGSRPHPTTMLRRLQKGRVAGYAAVFEGQWYAVPALPTTDNELANRIIRKHVAA